MRYRVFMPPPPPLTHTPAPTVRNPIPSYILCICVHVIGKRVDILQGACGAEERKDTVEGSLKRSTGSTVWFRIPFHDNRKQTTRPVAKRGGGSGVNSRLNKRRGSSDTASPTSPTSPGAHQRRERKVAQFIQPTDTDTTTLKPLLTALVVDDSIPILKMTALVLEKHGCKVEKAKNGLLGLEKMKAGLYDLVVMDVQVSVIFHCSLPSVIV